jgi:hypothetical protein
MCQICGEPSGPRGYCDTCRKLLNPAGALNRTWTDLDARRNALQEQWDAAAKVFRCAYSDLPLSDEYPEALRPAWVLRDPTEMSSVALAATFVKDMKADLDDEAFRAIVAGLHAHLDLGEPFDASVVPLSWRPDGEIVSTPIAEPPVISATTSSPEVDGAVEAVLAEVRATIGTGPFQAWGGWQHMGAIVCDAGLQAGVRYDTVVRPRVEHLIAAWPDATLSTFEAHIEDPPALEKVLRFKGRKLDTIRQLTSHLRAEQIDTVQEFSAWLDLPSNATSLFEIKGIKDKTVDYLRLLVGLPGAAVDRHLRRFVQRAWPAATTYVEVHDLVVRAAEAGGHDLGGLEHAIWNYESRQLRSTAAQIALDPQHDAAAPAHSFG